MPIRRLCHPTHLPPIPRPRKGSQTPACTTQTPIRPSLPPFHPLPSFPTPIGRNVRLWRESIPHLSRHSRASTWESIPRRGAAHPERRVEGSSEGWPTLANSLPVPPPTPPSFQAPIGNPSPLPPPSTELEADVALLRPRLPLFLSPPLPLRP